MAEYLWAVQAEDGREVLAYVGDTSRVSDFDAIVQREAGGSFYTTQIRENGNAVADGTLSGRYGQSWFEGLRFLRWPSDDRLSDPVSHPVTLDFEFDPPPVEEASAVEPADQNGDPSE